MELRCDSEIAMRIKRMDFFARQGARRRPRLTTCRGRLRIAYGNDEQRRHAKKDAVLCNAISVSQRRGRAELIDEMIAPNAIAHGLENPNANELRISARVFSFSAVAGCRCAPTGRWILRCAGQFRAAGHHARGAVVSKRDAAADVALSCVSIRACEPIAQEAST